MVPNFQVFGDEVHGFVVEKSAAGEPEATQALGLRDGRSVRIPDFTALFPHHMRIRGRSLLLGQTSSTGERTLRLYDVQMGKDEWQQTFPAKSLLLECRDSSLAGMLQLDGTLRLFDLNARTEVLHARLGSAVRETMGPALLLRDRARFYLILDEGSGPGQSNFAGLLTTPLRSATVWAFDRQGKLLWRTAEPVQNQTLLLQQFQDLPTLVFSSRLLKAQPIAVRSAAAYLVVTRCLDKATGKEVYSRTESHTGQTSQFYELRIERAAGTWELRSEQRTLRFTCAGGKMGSNEDK
jgi:hypothetical protein